MFMTITLRTHSLATFIPSLITPILTMDLNLILIPTLTLNPSPILVPGNSEDGPKLHHFAKMSSLCRLKDRNTGTHTQKTTLGNSTSAQHKVQPPQPVPFLMPPPFTKPLMYIPGLPIKRPRCNDAVPPGTVKNNISQSRIKTAWEGQNKTNPNDEGLRCKWSSKKALASP